MSDDQTETIGCVAVIIAIIVCFTIYNVVWLFLHARGAA